MSIRYKLLAIMLVLTAVSLGAFLALAVNLFKNDKIAYIYESTSSQARNVATQVQNEIKMHQERAHLYLTNFENNRSDFDLTARGVFNKNQTAMNVTISLWNGQEFSDLKELSKPSFDKKDQSVIDPVLKKVRAGALRDGVSFQISPQDFNYFIFAEKFNLPGDPNTYTITTVDREESISGILKKSPLFETYIVDFQGNIILQSRDDATLTDVSNWSFFKELDKTNVLEGTSEVPSVSGERSLVAFARVGTGNLLAISVVSKKVALRAIDVLLYKSALFFLVLISLSALVAVFSSKQITGRLRMLDEATSRLGMGDFDADLNLNLKSNDEVGRLSKNFSLMASKISSLMKENREKARMEKELETAKMVQDTLFPERNKTLGPIKISGYCEPASECGGDWWYYFELGDRVFVCIGDATGHGAPAAMITSAARSAVSLIETTPGVTPASFLQLLNRAVFEASRGKIQMTFFVACIDTKAKKLTYASASHNAPFLIKKSNEPVQKKDLIPLLMTKDGNRLGQELASRYEEDSMEMKEGDRIFFYTDGLIDLKDPKGEILQERGMIRTLLGAAAQGGDVKEMVEMIASDANKFRDKSMLSDDMTFFACEFLE